MKTVILTLGLGAALLAGCKKDDINSQQDNRPDVVCKVTYSHEPPYKLYFGYQKPNQSFTEAISKTMKTKDTTFTYILKGGDNFRMDISEGNAGIGKPMLLKFEVAEVSYVKEFKGISTGSATLTEIVP